MSLPKLTAYIGENVSEGNKNEFSSLIKNVKKIKEDEEAYVVFLIIDLAKAQIYFKLEKKFNQDTIYNYFYFGNNSAASSQYYLVRETGSIKYLLSSTFSDLYQLLSKNNMANGELGNLIKTMQGKEIVFLAENKGKGKLNLDKFFVEKSGVGDKIELDEKNNGSVNTFV